MIKKCGVKWVKNVKFLIFGSKIGDPIYAAPSVKNSHQGSILILTEGAVDGVFSNLRHELSCSVLYIAFNSILVVILELVLKSESSLEFASQHLCQFGLAPRNFLKNH